MIKKNVIGFIASVAFIFIIAPGVQAAQYTMKIASAGPMSSATLSAPTFFKAAIERQSGGKISVQLFDSGQMGSEHDVYMKTKMGALQAGMTSVFETSRHATPHMLASMLPFVWTPENFEKFMKTEAYKPFFHSIDKEGMTMLGFTHVGFYGFVSTKPIRSLDDLKKAGKIRVTEAPMARGIMDSFGVTPAVMAWGEIYQALQRGVITGVNHSGEFLVAAKLHEPCKYFTNLKHMFPQSVFYVNTKWFNKLPVDLQQLVIVNGATACTAARELAGLKRDMAFKIMTDSGIEIITPKAADKAEFISAADKVHQEYGKQIGAQYMKQIYGITGYSK